MKIFINYSYTSEFFICLHPKNDKINNYSYTNSYININENNLLLKSIGYDGFEYIIKTSDIEKYFHERNRKFENHTHNPFFAIKYDIKLIKEFVNGKESLLNKIKRYYEKIRSYKK